MPAPESAPSAAAIIDDLMPRARQAQRQLEAGGQALADRAALAAGWTLLQPQHNQRLAELAVATTGLGNVADKVVKNHRKTLGLLRDMHGVKTLGIIREDAANGITELRRPIGVVAALTPSTNPVATPANNIINALKSGNAIILAPSPAGMACADALLQLIYAEFERIGLTYGRGLVQMLPHAERGLTNALMQAADIVVVTGSQANVRNGYKSGTPALGVGAGNVATIVDETADIEAAAEKICRSKIFDNATSCSSENSLIALEAVGETILAALQQQGGLLLSAADKMRLQTLLWRDGRLNRELIAKDAPTLIAALNTQRQAAGEETLDGAGVKFLMVREEGVGADYPYSGEKMAPVLAVYSAADFTAAQRLADQLLRHQGCGHSVGIHTQDDTRPLQLAQQLPACRVIVNQAHCFATGGAFNNGLPFSLSMGCGTWGGNSFSENFNFRLLSQKVVIARPIAAKEPNLDDIMGDYWAQVGR